MLTDMERKLLAALEPRASQEGIEIVTIDIVGGRKSPTIRVFIDHPEGVSFDVLSKSQAWINDLMDRIDPFPGAYTLEVSSPGIDRPLRTLEHFQRFAGETVNLKTTRPISERSSWTGVLLGVDGTDVCLDVDGVHQAIPYESIKRAHVKGAIDFSQ